MIIFYCVCGGFLHSFMQYLFYCDPHLCGHEVVECAGPFRPRGSGAGRRVAPLVAVGRARRVWWYSPLVSFFVARSFIHTALLSRIWVPRRPRCFLDFSSPSTNIHGGGRLAQERHRPSRDFLSRPLYLLFHCRTSGRPTDIPRFRADFKRMGPDGHSHCRCADTTTSALSAPVWQRSTTIKPPTGGPVSAHRNVPARDALAGSPCGAATATKQLQYGLMRFLLLTTEHIGGMLKDSIRSTTN